MKVTAVQPQGQITAQTTHNTDSRAKAIAAFMGENKAAQSQTEAVKNPSQVQPEEMTAVTQIETKGTTQEKAQETSEITDKSANTEGVSKLDAKEETSAKVDEEATKRFQELANQEKLLRIKAQKQAQQIKQQQEALQAEKDALSGKLKTYESGYIQIDRLKTDPLGVLAESGIDYNDLTQQILNQQPTDPRLNAHIAKLEAKIKSLEEASERSAKQAEEQQQTSYKQAIKQITRDTEKLVKDNGDYEFIAKTNSVKDVVALIERTHREDGILLSVEEAAQLVEDHLADDYFNKINNIEKIKKRLAETKSTDSDKAKQEKEVKATTEQKQMKTLTNQASSTRKLSSRERAVLAFKGELKG